jgi:transcriptional regulator with XRE-family HTH domain
MYENRVYSPWRLKEGTAAVTKHQHPDAIGFGTRLAQLRKAAGYTQHQLADEIGATRRKIAYYESESEHPPANLLADLARVLNVSTDDLLGLNGSRKRAKVITVSPRLERRMRQIEALAPKPKQQLLGLIDTFIAAAEQPRHGAKP